ncbi:MAG: outer membrane beta-barrel protein [Verrucomicrobiota bacterium]
MLIFIFFVLGIVLAVPMQARAGNDRGVSATDTKIILQTGFVETVQKEIKLSGYVDAGYGYNFVGSAGQSEINSRPIGSQARGDFDLYALKIAMERALTSENKAQTGFRFDWLVGEDAIYFSNWNSVGSINTQMDSNAFYLEQAYALFRIPVGHGWDWKAGKFLSILGYEAIERPANMNITYGLIFQNGCSLDYTGVLTLYRFNELLDAKFGVANGANSDNNTTLNNLGDGATVLASLHVAAPGGKANWCHNFIYETATANDTAISTTASSYSVAAANQASGASYIYNSWGNWAPEFANDRWLVAFNSLLGTYAPSGGPAAGATTWYGVGLYSKYQLNDWFYLAGRGEYFGSDNLNLGLNTPATASGNGSVSWWEYTITAGFTVIDNLLLRAEYRLDWGTNMVETGGNALGGSGGPAHYAGAEVVFSF